MVSQSRTDTVPEVALRSALHRRGLRFRKHIRPIPELRCSADAVFTVAKVAVFCDGCFWHGCPVHGTLPRANRDWWRDKLDRTVARDRRNDGALNDAGWIVVRVWEHEDMEAAASRIADIISERRG